MAKEETVCWTQYTPPAQMAQLYAAASPEEQAEFDALNAKLQKERLSRESSLWAHMHECLRTRRAPTHA